MAKEENKKSDVSKEMKEWEKDQSDDGVQKAEDPEKAVEKTMDALSEKGQETKKASAPKLIKMGGNVYERVEPEAPKQIKVAGVLYTRMDDGEVRIAGKMYKKAAISAEEAMQAANDIATDIRTLAPFLKQLKMDKDYDNMMGVAQVFDQMVNRILKTQS